MSSISKMVSLVVLAATAALSGCDGGGIGEGNALASIAVVRQTGVLGTGSNRSFLCVRDSLSLIGTFTDGSRGDYTTRAVWRSSNPAILEVSSGEILVDPADPTQGTFLHGTLIPHAVTAPGETVRITASFVGLQATYDVSVGDPGAFSIVPSSQADADAPVLPQNVAAGSIEPLIAYGEFDGYRINVTGAAEWTFVPDPSVEDIDDIATIGPANGIVIGVAAGGPLTARASFEVCDREATTTVQVRDVAALTLSHEFDASTSSNIGELVIGTSEQLRVRGSFAAGPTQDLTAQVLLTSSQPTLISTPALALRTGVLGVAAGSSDITTCFDPKPTDNDADADADPVTESCSATDPNRVVSAALPLTAVARTLASLDIVPQNPSITAVGTQQFRARGTFADGVTQDITRHVAWSSSDPAVAVISSQPALAGLAVSVGLIQGSTDIGATYTLADPDLVAPLTKLCVYPPETPEAARVCPIPAPAP